MNTNYSFTLNNRNIMVK